MSLHEGSRVSYIGDGRDGRVLGEHGTLLVRSGSKGTVRWEDSSISDAYLDDLAPVTRGRVAVRDDSLGLDDSLEVGSIQAIGVRGLFDREGSVGVLNAMATHGSLSGFSEIAQDALAYVAQRIRSEPAFREVVAQLDDDESEELFTTASQALLRDAFGEPDG